MGWRFYAPAAGDSGPRSCAKAEVIGTLLTSEALRIEDAPRVWLALNAFAAGTVGFADCLIDIVHQQAEGETTPTFDKKAARLTTHRLLG